jgi:predicted nucleic acid-binding protein
MERVVVDSSLAIKWFFPEEHSDTAIFFLRDCVKRGIDRLVPSWFMCEFSNFVHQRVRREVMPLKAAQDNLRDMVRLVHIADFDPEVTVRGLEIAHQLRWRASYDPHYLAMAEHLGCECWTADLAFWQAASPTFSMIRWVGELDAADSRPTI